MNKLKMHTPDLVNANVERIAEIFPTCVTESRDEHGKVTRSIDFDLLKQELSDRIVEGPQERYRLDWPGKREALLAANAPIAKTLRPCREESVDFDATRNLFIEGDNLDALKLLQETYLGKVKMIYFDPPYNTGNDFLYNDDFAETTAGYLERSRQSGNQTRLVANSEVNGRFHSDWLSMIYPRLRLARNLLADEGIIYISLDDGEISNLRNICNEIFGEDKFIALFVWKSRQNKDNRSKNGASVDHEYVLTYGNKLRGADRLLTSYSNPDKDSRGDWTSANMVGLATADRRPNLHYDLIDPDSSINYGCPPMGWRYDRKRMAKLIEEKRVLWPATPDGRPRRKLFLSDLESERTGFSSVIGENIYTRNGTSDIELLFDSRVMDFPKPVLLLKQLISQANVGTDDTVFDFFAGSASTAHALMQLNAEDGFRRRFVMVQLPEKTDESSEACKAGYNGIAEIGKERIRRAGAKIKADNAGKVGIDKLDVGFRVLKIDTSNMAEVYYKPDELKQEQLLGQVDNVKPGRTAEDLLFQVLLDWGVDLSLPIVRERIERREVFLVDGNALAACFVTDGSVDEAFVKKLAARKPLRVVFRDAGFASDNARVNVEQIFKTLSPETEVRTL